MQRDPCRLLSTKRVCGFVDQFGDRNPLIKPFLVPFFSGLRTLIVGIVAGSHDLPDQRIIVHHVVDES